MYTIFVIDLTPYTYRTKEEFVSSEIIFDRFYKDNPIWAGFNFCPSNEHVTKKYKKHIVLNEGDRISINGEFLIVEWKCFYIDENYIEYSLTSE